MKTPPFLGKKNEYIARQGINTLGANSIFFFKNKPEFESPLIRPLLKSSDIHPFRCKPSYYVLLPYIDGKLIGEEILINTYPSAYNYLFKNKDSLSDRKSRFSKSCWYTLFGIGDYTFSKYKVVWRGLGAREMMAAVIEDGIPNQAMNCYISTSSFDEANYLCGILNSELFKNQLFQLNQAGSKSFAQPSTINKIYIPKFSNQNSIMNRISSLSKDIHISGNLSNINKINSLVQNLYSL